MNVDRLVRRRWLGWSIGAALLVLAGAILAMTVTVHSGSGSGSCGSAWDVLAGRSGWQQWWALDQAEPAPGAPLLRTGECPGAVNARIASATGLALGAVVAISAAALLGSRRRIDAVHSAPARRIRVLGAASTSLGVVLAVAGVVGLALLVADPNAPLFLYVGRPVVVLLGLLLLLPPVLLIVLGRFAGAVAQHLDRDRPDDESP